MKSPPDAFEENVLRGWPSSPEGSVDDSGSVVEESLEPGLTLRSIYSNQDAAARPAGPALAPQSPWSIVARVDPQCVDIARLHLHASGVDDLRGALVAWDEPQPAWLSELAARGLTCFVDGSLTSRHPSWRDSTEDIVLLDDPLSRSLLGTLESETCDHPRTDVTVDVRNFVHLQSSIAEITSALGVLAEYLVGGDSLQRIRILIPCSQKLFLTVARIRAMRILARQVLFAFPVDPSVLEIWGFVDPGCTCPDRSTHQIRAAVGAVGAVLGACDIVVAEPFRGAQASDLHSLRLAISMLRILKLESHLGDSPDLLFGAYYVEALTRQIVDRCWNAFLEIEGAGGITRASETSALSNILESSSTGGSKHGEA